MTLIIKLKRRPRHFFRTSTFIILFLITLRILNNLFLSGEEPIYPCSQLCSYTSQLTQTSLQFNSSYIIRHFPNFVCPQNFRNLADWVYEWPDQFDEHIQISTSKGKSIAPCLPPGSIIYVRIWAIDTFFRHIYPYLINNFVLITGEGDVSSPTHLTYLQASDSKIIHWFGQNGQYPASTYEKFTHLPIGINCFQMADGIETVYSEQREHTLPPIYNETDEPSSYIHLQDVSYRALTTTIPAKNLVLINFDSGTDGTGHRANLLRTICRRKFLSNVSYITCLRKPNGVQIENLPNIYRTNRQYAFWLSPRGGGLDCHRTWEALYLDIIPIVWNSSLNILYENLPVLIINDHKELNESFLYEKLREMSGKKLSNKKIYHFEKLRHAYWRRLILAKSRHQQNNDIYQRSNLCWSAYSTTKHQRFLGFFF
ncbi:hypothetical protein I4U23_006929 [Adineta vaga]|nr:hypothetical protein I4U23_006929 [Adineta vaga]